MPGIQPILANYIGVSPLWSGTRTVAHERPHDNHRPPQLNIGQRGQPRQPRRLTSSDRGACSAETWGTAVAHRSWPP